MNDRLGRCGACGGELPETGFHACNITGAWGPRDALYDENTRLREQLGRVEADLAALRHIDKLYDDVCRELPLEAGPEDEAADVVKRIVAERDALRQRHAEAVEAAFREAAELFIPRDRMDTSERLERAWLASEAKKGLT